MPEKQDPLASPIEAAVEATPTGVKAIVRSRIVSALDFLGAGKLQRRALSDVEAIAEFEREQEREEVLSQAYTNALAKQVESSPQLVGRMLARRYQKEVRQQENLEAVLFEAIEDLRSRPPTEEQVSAGNDSPDPNFLGRIETHAERASTDELRKKWAAVLAAEIREPGTFSPAALRIVDEIDPDIAREFNMFASNRIRNGVPYCLVENNQQLLADFGAAGLIQSTGFAQTALFLNTKDSTGTSVVVFGCAEGFFGVQLEALRMIKPEDRRSLGLHVDEEGQRDQVSFSVHLFTRPGEAISKLVGDVDLSNTAVFAQMLRDVIGHDQVQTYRLIPGTVELAPADLTPEVRKLDVWPPKDS
ncbi:DUF2806 domain-containing protein [Amorphus orientalis]|uniref:DUF2806 domain-containing protein n=1 Tax=Amorphus orientalis TaxID=649198 RepID=A0AAE3VQD8_9HYPH|nr:DUF2806 domain-containing protein [Amorphus orientalis]MDQ0316253.1 hypothetical protein [Amorphus orientalis]